MGTRAGVAPAVESFQEDRTMTTTVRQILAGKADVYMVSPDDTIFDALRLMADKNVGAVLVLSGGEIAGIVSERDYARKVVLLGRTSKTTPVREIMTTEVVSVEPGWTADQCMALMTDRRIRHLPVVENGALVGIISIGDVVRAVVDSQKFVIKSLENYIMS
jgi:CBS domain-containing protein